MSEEVVAAVLVHLFYWGNWKPCPYSMVPIETLCKLSFELIGVWFDGVIEGIVLRSGVTFEVKFDRRQQFVTNSVDGSKICKKSRNHTSPVSFKSFEFPVLTCLIHREMTSAPQLVGCWCVSKSAEVLARAVIDSTDIDVLIHILKYRYIDTHFKISLYWYTF